MDQWIGRFHEATPATAYQELFARWFEFEPSAHSCAFTDIANLREDVAWKTPGGPNEARSSTAGEVVISAPATSRAKPLRSHHSRWTRPASAESHALPSSRIPEDGRCYWDGVLLGSRPLGFPDY